MNTAVYLFVVVILVGPMVARALRVANRLRR